MRTILKIALGIIAAIGGFVDIGDIVFNFGAGAAFGYELMWAVAVGVLGIVLFSEMSGRVAIVAGKANLELVKEHYGPRLGEITLVSSLVLTFFTLAAEIGGVGIVLELFFDGPRQTFALIGVAVLIAAAYFLSFEQLERVFGYGGLLLIVYLVAAIDLDPDWGDIASGFVPHFEANTLYMYFAVGLIAAALMPYEIYFYSSGAIEEEWTEKDLPVNRANAIVGFGLGGLLSVALMAVSAQVYGPAGVQPDSLGAVALGAQVPFGEVGLGLGLLGMLFAIGGASIDTCFSGAYNLAQYRGWDWGKLKGHRGAPRWYLSALVLFCAGYAVSATGIDPVQLTEYAVVLSVVALPLTYLPILLVSGNRDVMGDHVNSRFVSAIGWGYFGLICVLTVAAPVLLVATNAGGG